VRAYPYGYRSSGSDEIRQLTGADVPYVRADWFVFQASTPPLYHEILRLPSTVKELEEREEVNVAQDFAENNLIRAGFTDSGVSKNNRIIERHVAVNGAYWRSYDFLNSEGANNISTNPLTFQAAGGEIIFKLPNGLQAYLLADAQGKRLDGAASSKIVHDDIGGIVSEVTNGRSCMGYHFKGMLNKADAVRTGVINVPSFRNYEKVLAVYRGQTELDAFFKKDDARFRNAILATGGETTKAEPVNELSKKYDKKVSLELAAAELGLESGAFRLKIHDNPTLGNLGFEQLLQPGGLYPRDAWEGIFPEVLSALRLGTPAPHVLIRESSSPAPVNPAPVVPKSFSGKSKTTLQWAKQDNGSAVIQQEASNYCRSSLEGFGDWRLPTIDELQSIYDPAADDGKRHHVAHGIKLSGSIVWSSTPGERSGEAWVFHFTFGKRDSTRVGNAGIIQALCVRRAGD
jgi:hypothetical protein